MRACRVFCVLFLVLYLFLFSWRPEIYIRLALQHSVLYASRRVMSETSGIQGLDLVFLFIRFKEINLSKGRKKTTSTPLC